MDNTSIRMSEHCMESHSGRQ